MLPGVLLEVADGWKELLLEMLLFSKILFPPVLPPKRFVGGGPAGVVDGLKDKPDGAGVVEPAGADVIAPADEAPPKTLFSPSGSNWEPAPNAGFGGVCEPPRLAKDVAPEPKPATADPLPLLFSAVNPFDFGFRLPSMSRMQENSNRLLPACRHL